MQHLAGVRPRREQRVIAELVRVPEAGALLVLAGDFADRRVDIDHQRRRTRPSTRRPRPAEAVADHGFHLAAMTERERPQKRPQRRRGHHPMPQHRGRRSRSQHVGVIDVRSTHAQRVGERQHFAPRASTADTAVKADGRVDQRLQTQPLRQRRHQQQARVRDQIRVIKSRVDPVKPMRYSRH